MARIEDVVTGVNICQELVLWIEWKRELFMLQVICRFWMVCKMKVMLSENADVYKEMAACSSVLAWETPWTEEPGGLPSMGLQDLDMT